MTNNKPEDKNSTIEARLTRAQKDIEAIKIAVSVLSLIYMIFFVIMMFNQSP